MSDHVLPKCETDPGVVSGQVADRPLGNIDGNGNDDMVDRLGVGSRTASCRGVLVERRLDPTRYLHTRTDEHSPQSQVDFDDDQHAFSPPPHPSARMVR